MNQGDVLALQAGSFDSTWGAASGLSLGVGKLNPEQANAFIDYVFDQTVLKDIARIIRMDAAQARVPKIGLGDKVLKPATAGIDPGITAQSAVSEVTLNTKEVIAEVQILDNELEDNVERGAYMDHLLRMLGVKIGNQLEQAYLLGQAAPGGVIAVDILQLFNGWYYQVTQNGGHVVDGSPAGGVYANRFISTQKLSKLIKAIPPKYRTRALDYRYLVSPNMYQDYIDILGNRATPLGDVAFRAAGYEQNLPAMGALSVLGYGAIPILHVPLLPENQFVPAASSTLATTLNGAVAAGAAAATFTSVTNLVVGDYVKVDTTGITEVLQVSAINSNVVSFNSAFSYNHANGTAAVRGTADGTFIMATHAQNLIVGIQRDIRIELDRRPRERATYAVVTMRLDATMENSDAAGVLQNLAIQP